MNTTTTTESASNDPTSTNSPSKAQTDSVLDALEHATRAASSVLDSIVGIGRRSRGSGVIVAPNRVLTSAHNLRDRTTQVNFPDGTQGALLGVDPAGDLAVLEVDTGDRPAVTWSAEPAELGQIVFAASASQQGARLTWGTVSATDRTFRGPHRRPITGAIEHTAPLPRGASGGVVVDRTGAVLGINTHRLGDGFYLARPATTDLRSIVDRLSEGVDVRPRTLGISIAPPKAARHLRASVGLPERDGILIRDVDDGSPADAAGLKRGDLIVAVGDGEITQIPELYAALELVADGDTLTLGIVRATDELTVTVRFEATASESPEG